MHERKVKKSFFSLLYVFLYTKKENISSSKLIEESFAFFNKYSISRHILFCTTSQMELTNESYSVTNRNSSEEYNEQSLLLTNDIHGVSNRLETVSINDLSFIKNLEEWRHEAHQIIDRFCQSKHDEYVRRTKEEIDRLKETVHLLSSDHDAADDYIDWVKETIQSIHQQLDELQQIQDKFSPLKFEKSTIYFPREISDLKRQPTPLKGLFSFSSSSTNELTSSLSPFSPFHFTATTSKNNQFFSFQSSKDRLKLPPDHWYPFATNETHLLVTGKSNLFLIDHSLTIVNKKSFVQVGLKDICWSKSVSRFILIFPKEILLFNEQNLSFESCSITLGHHNPWERGTCTETTLFLSTFGENPIIIEYNLFPSIHFNKRYQSTTICKETEIINDMKTNEISLALIIDNGFLNQTRLELRSIKSFEYLWSIDLGRGWGYRCSPLNHTHWIVTDSYNQRLIHINDHGTIDKIINTPMKPFNVVHWGQHQFLIRNVDGINIHQ